MISSKSGKRERGLLQNPATEREDLFKIQQEREKELFKIQQEREDFFKIQQEREKDFFKIQQERAMRGVTQKPAREVEASSWWTMSGP